MVRVRGFTLIELLVSLSIIALLGLMAVPGTVRAIARGAANKAAEDVLRVAHQAQQRAKTGVASGPAATAPHWGVAIVADGGRTWTTVLHGTAGTDEWLVDGTPGFRLDLPVHMAVRADTGSGLQELTAGRIAWFYQYGTGWPLESPAKQVPIGVGTGHQDEVLPDKVGSGNDYRVFGQYIPEIQTSPVCGRLELGARGSRYAVGIAIYEFGMANTYGSGN